MVYLQFRQWQDFNWAVFVSYVHQLGWGHLAAATALIFSVYGARALRWKLFVSTTHQTSAWRLLAPTMIGFTGVALLGRPGELVRPYLIARRENISFSSQMAVWATERVFDIGAFTVIVGLTILVAEDLRAVPYVARFRQFGLFMMLMVIAMATFLVLLRRNRERVTALVHDVIARFSRQAADEVAGRVRAFGEGLNTISSGGAAVSLGLLSLGIWIAIAAAYWEVTRAYPSPVNQLPLGHVLLLLGFGIAGSSVQLPMVGGGAQLATIAAMVHVFHLPHEVAVSCGIMLWLVTFMAVAPVGLWLARREHVSFRRMEERIADARMSASQGG